MKQQTVVIKSNKYGITLFLDRNIPFRELLENIADRFRASSEFSGMPGWRLPLTGGD